MRDLKSSVLFWSNSSSLVGLILLRIASVRADNSSCRAINLFVSETNSSGGCPLGDSSPAIYYIKDVVHKLLKGGRSLSKVLGQIDTILETRIRLFIEKNSIKKLMG